MEAEALLTALAKELDKTHPSAANSLREGLAETLTVLRLGVDPSLARTLRSTKAIENMTGICRDHSSNVKRWGTGQWSHPPGRAARRPGSRDHQARHHRECPTRGAR